MPNVRRIAREAAEEEPVILEERAPDPIPEPIVNNLLVDEDPFADMDLGELEDRMQEEMEQEIREEINRRAEQAGLEILADGPAPIDNPIEFVNPVGEHFWIPPNALVAPPPVDPEARERRRREQERRAEDVLRMHREVFRGGPGPRRGGARVRVDGDVEIPADIAEEPMRHPPRPMPQPMRKAAPRVPRKKVYPEEGVMFRGRKFARALSPYEQDFYLDYGYTQAINKYPDIEFKEKEKPIDDKEECIILMSELADYYATEECKRTIENFDLKDHNKEYQASYKKHLKVVTGFKRNKNG